MPLRAVLFDMDGVLVDSEEVWFRVVEAAGVKFRGRAISREEFAPTFGQGTAADLPAFGLTCTADELDRFYEREFPRFLSQVWVNPDAQQVLEAVGARGLGCAVVTNTVLQLTEAILGHAKLRGLVQVLAASDRVPHAKPAPDSVQLACRELGVGADEVLMVGDSRYDRAAARAAGVRFIGYGIDGVSAASAALSGLLFRNR